MEPIEIEYYRQFSLETNEMLYQLRYFGKEKGFIITIARSMSKEKIGEALLDFLDKLEE